MLMKSEKYTNENGEERIKDYYSKIVDGIEIVTSTRDRIIEEPEPVDHESTEAEIAQAEMMLMQAEILEKLNQIGG